MRIAILIGCLVCQMGLGMTYVFAQFLRPVIEDLGWSRAAYASFGGPLLLSMSLASPLVGDLTDRLGARRVLSGSALLLGLALVAFGAMQSLWQFYAISLLLGVALAGLGDIPVGAVASRWFSGGRGLALGAIYLGSNLGGSIVPIAAAALTAQYGWRAALWVIGPAAVALILPFAALVVRHPRAGEVATGRPGPPVRGSGPALDPRAALRTRSFWILAFALFAFYFYYLGVLQNLPIFLTDLGFDDPQAALRYAGAIFVGIFGKLAMGLVSDRIPRHAAMLLNFGLVTLASLLLLYVDRPGVLLVFLAVHGFAVAAENVTLPVIVAEVFGVKHMAKIYGWLMITLFLGGTAGPVFAGWVHDRAGSYALAFQTFAGLNAVGLLALAFVRRETA